MVGARKIAQNNQKYDYVRMAYALALSIKHTQKTIKNVSIALPGSEEHLLTEKQRWIFDDVIELPWGDDAELTDWKINNKWKYVHCTPYKETVILDELLDEVKKVRNETAKNFRG